MTNGNGITPADPLRSVTSTLDAINLTFFQGASRDPIIGPLAKTVPPPPKISGVFSGQAGLPGLPQIQGFPKLPQIQGFPPLPNLSRLAIKQSGSGAFNGVDKSTIAVSERNVFS